MLTKNRNVAHILLWWSTANVALGLSTTQYKYVKVANINCHKNCLSALTGKDKKAKFALEQAMKALKRSRDIQGGSNMTGTICV